MIEYLDLDDALIIARAALGGQEVKVGDPGLLGSALYRPQSVAFGVEVYATLAEKAGALLHSLVMNHALFDGNKRLGWAAVLVFADLNGCEIDLTEDAAYELVMAVARGELDAAAIADRLRLGGVDR